jgi:predicted nucleic acid-binding protein
VTTALDTSVLLDVFMPDPAFAAGSQRAIEQCDLAGSLVVGEAVYAELAAYFSSKEQLEHTLRASDITVIGSGLDALFAGGRAWKAHRAAGGKRDRIVIDFMIGGHALKQADRLLTRDQGFYRQHFRGLVVTTPGDFT